MLIPQAKSSWLPQYRKSVKRWVRSVLNTVRSAIRGSTVPLGGGADDPIAAVAVLATGRILFDHDIGFALDDSQLREIAVTGARLHNPV